MQIKLRKKQSKSLLLKTNNVFFALSIINANNSAPEIEPIIQ